MKVRIQPFQGILKTYTTSTSVPKPKLTKQPLNKKPPIIFSNRSTSLKLSDFLPKPQLNPEVVVLPTELPYLNSTTGPIEYRETRKFYVEVYGCQMNVNDSEILMSVMHQAQFTLTKTLEEADIVFLVTCSIRDSAEQKIWHKLRQLKKLRRPHHPQNLPPTVGVLGCMAERLKGKLLEPGDLVDIVCGPDAYRSLPQLLTINQTTTQGVANVILSADETYADIVPVRKDERTKSVFVSIMRGCNNMCSYCIVPFTRGIERSRPIDSILQEVRRLSDQGVKEVVLLGQNVNSYRDTSTYTSTPNQVHLSNLGFQTIYKAKVGGLRFVELLDQVARIDPELRVRFTSPHPKDFPQPLLQLIGQTANLCSQLHLPAQSGNSWMLHRMRRGYSREAYLELIAQVRQLIPDVAISSDFITGFSGETEATHQDTVSLMESVGYDMAYLFKYSVRESTHAHRNFPDDVDEATKSRRLQELLEVFHRNAQLKLSHLVGRPQLVLIDGKPLAKHGKQGIQWMGRSDGNHKCFVTVSEGDPSNQTLVSKLKPGDYIEFYPLTATSTSLTGLAIQKTTLQQFFLRHKP